MLTPPSTVQTASRALEQRVEIETPEQIVFGYTIAGIGSRTAAALLDYVLLFVISVVLWFGAAVLDGALSGSFFVGEWSSWIVALAILGQFAVFWGYYVVFEAIWDGQTPGKRRLRIRVVQDGGYSVSFAASAIRNLARIIDGQPFPMYAVGLVSAAFSSTGKRLGDMLAGTIVVQERVFQAPAMAARPADAAVGPALAAQLDEREYELLERFLARRSTLDADRRRLMVEQLAERFASRLPEGSNTPLARLIALHEREQGARTQGVAARGDVGAARERHAIVARSMPRWNNFATRLTYAQQRGLANMSETEVSELVALYREVSTDFARLKTASQGREPDALFYVSRLIGAGHNLLYRQRRVALATAWRFFAIAVPSEIRRSAVPILIAALFLFGPMLVSYASVLANPALASELLPPGMLDRAEEGVQRAREGKGYISISELERPVMATSIIANNVQVTYGAFIFGITAGLGTLMLLVFNGVSIGAALGLYASKGILALIGAFVVPHGVFELTAICIAAGAGLLIGSAFVVPGDRTRREALVLRGRRGLRLVVGSTVFLLIAGGIEGLISPREDIPMSVRFAIAALSALLIVLYLALGRGAPEQVVEDFAYSDARALTSR